MRANFTFSYLDLKRISIFGAIPFKLGQNFYEFFFASHDPKRFGRAE